MRYLATIFWGAILGEVMGFLISALNGSTFDPGSSLVISLIFVILLFILPVIMKQFDTTPTKTNK
ncbi:YjzD family protein [Lacticaseibacillus brantae]|nr:YjzD family protein [Lacticaseibacillus brantae]